MAATMEDIKRWFQEGREQKATHMIIVCDEFDYEDYPVYVSRQENVRELYDTYNKKTIQKVMEVYSLRKDMEIQLAEFRAFHFD